MKSPSSPSPAALSLRGAVRCLAGLFTFALLLSAPSVRADEYDLLRQRVVDYLTGGTGIATGDADIAARTSALNTEANGYWTSMDKSAGRTYLWSDLTATSNRHSASLGRLRAMAIAYRTTGAGLNGNASLRSDLVSAVDWIYANWYSENTLRDSTTWWYTEVSAAKSLCDITALLYGDLTATQRTNYLNTVDHFVPTPRGFTGDYVAANRIWKMYSVMMSGILGKSATKLALARDTVSLALDYKTPGSSDTDGFYLDGSYFQHAWFPYAGAYGLSFLHDLGTALYVLDGSTWEVTDADVGNVYLWVYQSFEPILYRGLAMDAYRGRAAPRYLETDRDDGRLMIESIATISRIAPAPYADEMKAMVKYWAQNDPAGSVYGSMALSSIDYIKGVVAGSTVSRGELVEHVQYPIQDRVVHLRPGWGFTLGMFSNRTKNFETNGNENQRGWHTADGMTYLYNGTDYNQYADNYWPTVNPYRLAGTTVDVQTLAQGSGISTPWTSTMHWTGGSETGDGFGIAGMYLKAEQCTLTAKKSWFMFDDEVVCLGSGITSTDGRTIETIVETRKLNASGNNALVVNGTSKSTALTWTETMTGVTSMNLDGTGGYYFPTTTTVKGRRLARTGQWGDINNVYTDGVNWTRNYAELWIDHGTSPTNASYAYVILPNYTSAQTASYASSPEVSILENSTDAHAVSENTIGVKGYNFWNDITKTVGEVTVNKKASVVTRETGGQLEVGVSDPTHENTGTISVEIAKAATDVVSRDASVTVTQLTPTIKFTVNVNGAEGYSFKAKFQLAAGLVSSDFNADTTGGHPSGWTYSEVGGTATVATVPSASDKSVKLAETTTGAAGTSISKTFGPVSSAIVAEADVRADTGTDWGGFYLFSNSGVNAVAVIFASGSIKANIAGTWTTAGSYTAGSWYHVRLVADPSTGKFDLWLGNTQLLNQQSFRAAATDLGKVQFLVNETAGDIFYVNNVKVAAHVIDQVAPARPTPPAIPASAVMTANEENTSIGSVPSGWTATTNGVGTVSVQSYTNSGNWFAKSVRMVKTGTGFGVYFNRTFTAQSGTVKAAAYLTPTTTTGNWRMIVSSGATQAVKVVFAADGNVRVNDLSPSVMAYRANTPYLVEIKINTATDTYDLFIDSVLRVSGAALKNAVGSIDSLEFSAYSADLGTLYLDEIRVYNYDYQN